MLLVVDVAMFRTCCALGMCWSSSSNLNVVGIRHFFANLKSNGFSETFTSDSEF